jgi:hypothetical protein
MRVAWHQSAFLPLIGLLLGGAWLVLWLWAASPYGRYLDHGTWLRTGVAGALCQALPAGELLLFVLGDSRSFGGACWLSKGGSTSGAV